jgi:hypothetical protein
MENMEILQVIRSSAGVVEVLCTHIAPFDGDSPIRKEKIAKAEATFKAALSNLNEDDLDTALCDGYGEDDDGDCVNIVWSDIDE